MSRVVRERFRFPLMIIGSLLLEIIGKGFIRIFQGRKRRLEEGI